jgi:hypothetical protein
LRLEVVEVVLQLGLIFFRGFVAEDDGLGGESMGDGVGATAWRPWSVMGPRDLAPLAWADSGLRGEVDMGCSFRTSLRELHA